MSCTGERPADRECFVMSAKCSGRPNLVYKFATRLDRSQPARRQSSLHPLPVIISPIQHRAIFSLFPIPLTFADRFYCTFTLRTLLLGRHTYKSSPRLSNTFLIRPPIIYWCHLGRCDLTHSDYSLVYWFSLFHFPTCSLVGNAGRYQY